MDGRRVYQVEVISESDLGQIVEKAVALKMDKILSILSKIEKGKTYSVNEVAKITNQTPETVRRHIRNDLILKANRTGRSYIITQEQFEDYLAQDTIKNHLKNEQV